MNAIAPTELSALAADAGIAEQWTGADQRPQTVKPDTLRALLAAMDLPAGTDKDIRDSRQRLSAASGRKRLPAMLIAVTSEPVALPVQCAGRYEIHAESGAVLTGISTTDTDGFPSFPAPDTPGYYTLTTPAGMTTLAVAPPHAPTMDDLMQTQDARAWGLAAQVYSLRRPAPDLTHSTHGFGDFGALRELATAAGCAGADALAISPVHAMFAADPGQSSPYSPSSRLFLNTLYADPAAVLGHDAVRSALADMDQHMLHALDAQALINWPQAGRLRQQLLRSLYGQFAAHAPPQQRQAFAAYCLTAGQDLRDHALFEALHAAQAPPYGDPTPWTAWPAGLRDPRSAAAQGYVDAQADDVNVHMFNQWLASESLALAQQAARDAGMRIGLVADLAVGGSPLGSHAWSRQADLMKRTGVGAPPDLHNPRGQGWGLTALSPAALNTSGYAAFLAMLRANLAHAGGLRIDHILGMARLWLIPDGAGPQDGGYLRYPLKDLLRLTALEAWLHDALIIGENLGTVPEGFDDELHAHGLLGMNVLWFMREPGAGATGPAAFIPPQNWPPHAVAMTTTHDLPTLEGWWHAQDIRWRTRLGLLGDDQDESLLRLARLEDREALWRAVQASPATAAMRTMPRETPGADLLGYVASSPCPLMLVPLEDIAGRLDQPNLPGTISNHPNWRQRLPLSVSDCLNTPESQARLQPVLAQRGRQ
ncbi:4-alpha-glucanotransferase [Achromobacter seleniivolatilans]|uniref:4-alpha-glucanotransferase n=1 Tax=Achromobacter seleniivolatilans TaxID=3047478 RepID=A0ABY9M6I8_9BURK|nr:4-alpha-glucanotransferase [Achromobacter sp. R39]WMD22218.1 4-alpha-glucanotransferase [Achromobacter sp. R39]